MTGASASYIPVQMTGPSPQPVVINAASKSSSVSNLLQAATLVVLLVNIFFMFQVYQQGVRLENIYLQAQRSTVGKILLNDWSLFDPYQPLNLATILNDDVLHFDHVTLANKTLQLALKVENTCSDFIVRGLPWKNAFRECATISSLIGSVARHVTKIPPITTPPQDNANGIVQQAAPNSTNIMDTILTSLSEFLPWAEAQLEEPPMQHLAQSCAQAVTNFNRVAWWGVYNRYSDNGSHERDTWSIHNDVIHKLDIIKNTCRHIAHWDSGSDSTYEPSWLSETESTFSTYYGQNDEQEQAVADQVLEK